MSEKALDQLATWLETLEGKGGAPMPDESEFHFENQDDFIRGMEWAATQVRNYPAHILLTPDAEPVAEVDIVFDGPPGHESGRFVEVESPPGTSIRFGEWIQREDGYWVLRISPPDTTAQEEELGESDFMKNPEWDMLTMNGSRAGLSLTRLPDGMVSVKVRRIGR